MDESTGRFNPMVSIVTVTLNARKHLEKTVQSIIGQTYENIEFIIIDGASKDGTMDVVRKYKGSVDHWVSEPDQGIYDAMNKGLSAATGDYVQFLNAGDYFVHDDSLENMINAAGAHHHVIYGDIMLRDLDGASSHHHKAKEFNLEQLKMYGTAVLCHQSMLVNRDIAPEYDISYKYKGELNWYFDICMQNKELNCFHFKHPLVHYGLDGVGYINFLTNRMEWYRLMVSRFGWPSVMNRQFLSFIYYDFNNRYAFLRKLDGVVKKYIRVIGKYTFPKRNTK